MANGLDQWRDLPPGEFLLTENDVDYFRLQISKTVYLAAATTSDLDTQGTLYDSSGTVLDFDDDGLIEDYPNDHNFLVLALVDPGTYYVKVQGSTGQTGPYSLYVATSYLDAAGKVVAQSIEQQMKQMLR